MAIGKVAKRIFYSRRAEQMKGAVKGQIIRIRDPKRYRELKEIRPNRKKLVLASKKLIDLIKKTFLSKGINAKVFGRVKTLGSIDRKEKQGRTLYPGHSIEYAKTDLLGTLVVVKSEVQCSFVLEQIKKLGKVVDIGFRNNPIDYVKEFDAIGRPELFKSGFSVILSIEGVPSNVYIRILSEDEYKKISLNRSNYKKYSNKK